MSNDITLRDFFAAIAMHAYLINHHDYLQASTEAYKAADEMLEERELKSKSG